MSPQSLDEYTEVIAKRYKRACYKTKNELLNEYCQVIPLLLIFASARAFNHCKRAVPTFWAIADLYKQSVRLVHPTGQYSVLAGNHDFT